MDVDNLWYVESRCCSTKLLKDKHHECFIYNKCMKYEYKLVLIMIDGIVRLSNDVWFSVVTIKPIQMSRKQFTNLQIYKILVLFIYIYIFREPVS